MHRGVTDAKPACGLGLAEVGAIEFTDLVGHRLAPTIEPSAPHRFRAAVPHRSASRGCRCDAPEPMIGLVISVSIEVLVFGLNLREIWDEEEAIQRGADHGVLKQSRLERFCSHPFREPSLSESS